MTQPSSISSLPQAATTTFRIRRYPAEVDDVTVRLVAGAVLIISSIGLVTGQWWIYALLALDFGARVLWGPSRSPLVTAIVRWVRPRVRLAPRPTAGSPKRFAAGIGAVMTLTAAVLGIVTLLTSNPVTGAIVIAIGVVMVVFPALEAFLGLCVGCKLFALMARLGLVREDVCVDCVGNNHRH